jgi:hypothetical protein
MNPLHLLAAHRHLALIEVTISTPLIQNLFIFKADEKNPSSSSLTVLPLCTKAMFHDPQPRSRRGVSKAIPRCMDSMSLGLWIDDKEEFIVAELTVDVTYTPKAAPALRPQLISAFCAPPSLTARLLAPANGTPFVQKSRLLLLMISGNSPIGRPMPPYLSGTGCAGSTTTKASSSGTC